MITMVDIQNAVIQSLAQGIPNHVIYREQNATNPKVPAFYVDVRNLETIVRKNYRNELVMVSIQYISKDRTKVENLIMTDRLKDCFGMMLKVKKRNLTIGELSIADVNGLLTISFTLDYNVDTPPKPTTDLGYGEGLTKLMEQLQLDKGDV